MSPVEFICDLRVADARFAALMKGERRRIKAQIVCVSCAFVDSIALAVLFCELDFADSSSAIALSTHSILR